MELTGYQDWGVVIEEEIELAQPSLTWIFNSVYPILPANIIRSLKNALGTNLSWYSLEYSDDLPNLPPTITYLSSGNQVFHKVCWLNVHGAGEHSQGAIQVECYLS